MAQVFPVDFTALTLDAVLKHTLVHLQERLLPDEHHCVWLRPELGGTPPDLVIAGPPYGVVVLNVLDWQPGHTKSAGKDFVRLTDTAEPRTRRRPGDGLTRAVKLVANRLQKELPELPVAGAILLPPWTRQDIDDGRKAGALHSEVVFGAGDLLGPDPLSALERLQNGAPQMAQAGQALRVLMQPQIHFLDLRAPGLSPAPEASPAPSPSSALEASPVPSLSPVPEISPAPSRPQGFFLDRKQERMARELASPRTLVYGPAGSGKTVFLAGRADYWMDMKPESKVLFTCYNSSLASYLRRLFAQRGKPADGERLTILHYHDLCRQLLGSGDDFHERKPEFYAGLEPRLLSVMAQRDDLDEYDLILVDEGQDFTRRMMEVLVRLNAHGGEITIVADPAQDIYLRWDESNVVPLGKFEVERLVDCYRNTEPIFSLARDVIGPKARKALGLDRLELTRPEDLGRDGPEPLMPRLENLEDLAELIQAEAGMLAAQGLGLNNIAVLYIDRHAVPGFSKKLAASPWAEAERWRQYIQPEEEGEETEGPVLGTLHDGGPKKESAPRPHFAGALEIELNTRGVAAEWVAKDFSAKSLYDISKERLSVSTIHSAKGMDFHTVILLGADTLEARDEHSVERQAAVLFTGITRARERLLIPSFEDAGWIPNLRKLITDSAKSNPVY